MKAESRELRIYKDKCLRCGRRAARWCHVYKDTRGEKCVYDTGKVLKNKNARQNCGERRHLFSTHYSSRLENIVKCYFRLFLVAAITRPPCSAARAAS
jgi:hypothetical protein